jgi:arylformamidase
MIYVENKIVDGIYFLNLQIPNFFLDAAPSRPILFRVKKQAYAKK